MFANRGVRCLQRILPDITSSTLAQFRLAHHNVECDNYNYEGYNDSFIIVKVEGPVEEHFATGSTKYV